MYFFLSFRSSSFKTLTLHLETKTSLRILICTLISKSFTHRLLLKNYYFVRRLNKHEFNACRLICEDYELLCNLKLLIYKHFYTFDCYILNKNDAI